jgi:glycosyltransferase involved in cell wall biosynthesis
MKPRDTTPEDWPLDLSIVIPVQDEAESVFLLAGEISEALEGQSWRWECLWVDDGSTDRTLAHLARIHRSDKRHHWLALERNYGQSAALAAGFSAARGRILVTLDGDGQNDPRGIPPLVERLLATEAHMVNGWRSRRRDNAVRRVSSSVSNAFRNWITGERIRDVGCALRAFRHECVSDIPVFKGMHRFLPTLVRLAGWDRIDEMPVPHRPRRFGETKYGIHNRLWVGLMDTFAVLWMRRRMVRPRIKTSSYGQPEGQEV